MEAEKYQIDKFDKSILMRLLHDARKPFLEIARELNVVGGTIHQRVERMREAGIIKGFSTLIQAEKVGFGIQAFVGVHVNQASDIENVVTQIKKIPQVTEAHYTTGNYALLIRVFARNMDDYYNLLTKKLQKIEGVRSTESFMCMASPIARPLPVDDVIKHSW